MIGDDAQMPRRTEAALVFAACALSLAFNLGTATRFPIPWLDEVMFTDPAVNLLLGRGFTTCTWPFQPCDAFWAGYPPLYPALLSAWLRVFGFGPVAVRSLDYVLIIVAVPTLWLAVARLGLVATARARLWLVALLLLGYGITFCYRSARPDCLGIAIVAAIGLAQSLHDVRLRCVATGALAMLLPLAGLQLLLYAVLMTGLLALHRGRAVVRELASGAVGLVAGVGLLRALYAAAGVWAAFVGATAGARSIIGRGLSLEGLAQTLRIYDRTLGGLYKDPSFVVLLAIAVAVAVYQRRARVPVAGTVLGFGLAVAAVVPVTLFLTGVYPVYYAWMAYMPLAIGVCAALAAVPPPIRARIEAGLVLTCALGLPLIVAWTAVDWADRDPARVEAALRDVIAPNDHAVIDYAAYYVVKPRVAKVFTDRSLRRMTPADTAAVDVLVIIPTQLDEISRALGGRWRATGATVRSRGGRDVGVSIWGPRYDLAVYRREPTGG